MSKLVNLKADGSLNISVESKLFQTIRNANSWFTNRNFSIPALIVLLVIDVAGFFQVAEATMSDSLQNRLLIVAAFGVAFELAPLYIGYAICLKSYKLGKPIHNLVLILSITAFLLGITSNGIYRWLTMDIAYKIPGVGGEFVTSDVALPMTYVMFILPVITSLVNIIIGCLIYDPILFDLKRISKKLSVLQVKKRQLLACIEEMANDTEEENTLIRDEELCYENQKSELNAMRTRLKNYIRVRLNEEENKC